MYHEVTYAEIRRRRRWRIVFIWVGLFLVANLVFAVFLSQSIARKQGATSLRESVLDAAAQCAAVEGSYPSSLEHLEDHYGLVINHEDYIVTYEWTADNIPPSVVVRRR